MTNEHGNAGHELIKQSMPMLFGLTMTAILGGLDAFFVGRLGSSALSALGFATAVTTLVFNAAIGLGVGVTATVGRAFGAHEHGVVTRLTLAALTAAGALGALAGGLLWTVHERTFSQLGADPDLLSRLRPYIAVYSVGIPLLAMLVAGTAALRGIGQMKQSGGLVVLSVLVTLLLEPPLMFGVGPWVGLGYPGSALALVLGYGVAALFTVRALMRAGLATRTLPSFGDLCAACRQMAKISLPATATYAMVPLGTSIVTRLLASYGKEAVAAGAVAARLQALTLIVPLAIAAALNPFVAQNLGAMRHGRIEDGLRDAGRWSVFWGAITGVLLVVFAEPVGSLFFREASLISLFRNCCRVLAWSFAPAGFAIVAGSAFNAGDQVVRASMLTFLRGIGAVLPLAICGRALFGFEGVLAGVSLANLLTALVAAFWLRTTRWQRTAELAHSAPR